MNTKGFSLPFSFKIHKVKIGNRTYEVVEDPLFVWDKKKKIYIPQPTRYWILDKELRKEIGRLEEKGYIAEFCKKITNDDDLFKFFVELHKKEVKKRIELFKKYYKDFYNYPLSSVILNEDIGIGGIGNYKNKPFKVKCLHLWTAYHLADKEFKNPIGEFVLSNIK
jgi:hypothetical protein